MSTVRREILNMLAEFSEHYPHWRFGQTIANISSWARPENSAVWDVEDDEFLAAMKKHLERKRTGEK